LSSISPWSYEGASATTLGVGTIVWLFVMSAIASALGGYVAGRLRAKWRDADSDEAFFRDTAHGFLAWSIATLLSAALLTSAATSMVGAAAKTGAAAATAVAGTAAAAGVATTQSNTQSNAAATGGNYYVDMLFRTDRAPEPGVDMNAAKLEAARILANALRQGELSQGDKAYLTQLVASRTGLSPADAEQRVTQTTTAARLAAEAAEAKARELADAARKATAYLALWIFASLLVGAFCAAYAATLGGRQRDDRSYRRVRS
jgi:hypothetical protein